MVHRIEVVKYRGADVVSKVRNELAGAFTYYADPEDAFKRHKFVERLTDWVDPTRPVSDYHFGAFDLLGKRFRNA